MSQLCFVICRQKKKKQLLKKISQVDSAEYQQKGLGDYKQSFSSSLKTSKIVALNIAKSLDA